MSCEQPVSTQCMCTNTRAHAHLLHAHSPSTSAWCAFQSWQHGKRGGVAVLYSTVQRTGFLCRSTREHHLPKKVSSLLHNVKRNLEKDSGAIFSGHLPGVFIGGTAPSLFAQMSFLPQSCSVQWNISHSSSPKKSHFSVHSQSCFGLIGAMER